MPKLLHNNSALAVSPSQILKDALGQVESSPTVFKRPDLSREGVSPWPVACAVFAIRALNSRRQPFPRWQLHLLPLEAQAAKDNKNALALCDDETSD